MSIQFSREVLLHTTNNFSVLCLVCFWIFSKLALIIFSITCMHYEARVNVQEQLGLILSFINYGFSDWLNKSLSVFNAEEAC